MDISQRSEVLRETEPVAGPRGNSGVDAVPREPRSNEQTPPRNPAEPSVPDEGTSETFVDGSGI
jgi:hypothetical protein